MAFKYESSNSFSLRDVVFLLSFSFFFKIFFFIKKQVKCGFLIFMVSTVKVHSDAANLASEHNFSNIFDF